MKLNIRFLIAISIITVFFALAISKCTSDYHEEIGSLELDNESMRDYISQLEAEAKVRNMTIETLSKMDTVDCTFLGKTAEEWYDKYTYLTFSLNKIRLTADTNEIKVNDLLIENSSLIDAVDHSRDMLQNAIDQIYIEYDPALDSTEYWKGMAMSYEAIIDGMVSRSMDQAKNFDDINEEDFRGIVMSYEPTQLYRNSVDLVSIPFDNSFNISYTRYQKVTPLAVGVGVFVQYDKLGFTPAFKLSYLFK
jgi:hypothetical protein